MKAIKRNEPHAIKKQKNDYLKKMTGFDYEPKKESLTDLNKDIDKNKTK